MFGHSPLVAEVELWIIQGLLIYGLVVGVWFLATWGPHVPKGQRRTLATMDVGGWVAAFVAIYAVTLVVSVFWPTPHHTESVVVSRTRLIVFLIIIDAAMTIRHLHWRRIRHRDESHDESSV